MALIRVLAATAATIIFLGAMIWVFEKTNINYIFILEI